MLIRELQHALPCLVVLHAKRRHVHVVREVQPILVRRRSEERTYVARCVLHAARCVLHAAGCIVRVTLACSYRRPYNRCVYDERSTMHGTKRVWRCARLCRSGRRQNMRTRPRAQMPPDMGRHGWFSLRGRSSEIWQSDLVWHEVSPRVTGDGRPPLEEREDHSGQKLK